jgi:hypothetical protein
VNRGPSLRSIAIPRAPPYRRFTRENSFLLIPHHRSLGSRGHTRTSREVRASSHDQRGRGRSSPPLSSLLPSSANRSGVFPWPAPPPRRASLLPPRGPLVVTVSRNGGCGNSRSTRGGGRALFARLVPPPPRRRRRRRRLLLSPNESMGESVVEPDGGRPSERAPQPDAGGGGGSQHPPPSPPPSPVSFATKTLGRLHSTRSPPIN